MFGIEIKEYFYKGYMDEITDKYISGRELYKSAKEANKGVDTILEDICKELKEDYEIEKSELNITDELREDKRFVRIYYEGNIEIDIVIEVIKFTIKG